MTQRLYILLLAITTVLTVNAQFLETSDGERISSNGRSSRQGEKTDTVGHKITPRGITVWTADEITGARKPAEPDTASFMRMNRVFASGVYGEYNTLGNNGSHRLNRIFIDREQPTDFTFLNGYSQFITAPGNFHFTNTFSPITNLDFNECGNQLLGEDHLKAAFAVNANKRLGVGFKFDYLYSRGYYANQSTSHFGFTLWESYLGDRYENHFLFTTNHQKQAENGGILDDNYIKHPELTPQDFEENEIPTVLEKNWNIHDNQHIFFTQRYNIGFYRKVPMTDQEKEAKKFAIAAEKEKQEREAAAKNGNDTDDSSSRSKRKKDDTPAPTGRPDNAKIAGNEPPKPEEKDNDRISLSVEEANDSDAADKLKAEEDLFMKEEYVPVTSFFHSTKFSKFTRTFRAYATPKDYYATDYYDLATDSIEDVNHLTYLRNNLGISMLEGFNKWAKMGISLFASHEMRHYAMPLPGRTFQKYTENNLILGGVLGKRQGKSFHFDARGQFYVLGDDVGDILIDGNADVNFPLLGDTVRLEANASFNLVEPDSYFCKYNSRHFRWDNDLSKETHLHFEGNLSFERLGTRLRLAFDNIGNYSYFGTSYTLDNNLNHIGTTITPHQSPSAIQILTAQLYQNLHFGIWHWDNIITFQKSSDNIVLPLPTLNIYSNMYLRFKIARVLHTDFGLDCRYFTEYNAPEYSAPMQSYVIQENESIRTKIGNYPIINVYFNFQLKTCRFFVMMSHVNCSGKGNYFLTPHHPINSRVLRIGVNWNFYN